MRKRSPAKEVEVVLLEKGLNSAHLRAYADRSNATIMLRIYDNTNGSTQVASLGPALIAQWDQVEEFVRGCIEMLVPPRRFDRAFIEKPVISEVGDRFPSLASYADRGVGADPESEQE